MSHSHCLFGHFKPVWNTHCSSSPKLSPFSYSLTLFFICSRWTSDTVFHNDKLHLSSPMKKVYLFMPFSALTVIFNAEWNMSGTDCSTSLQHSQTAVVHNSKPLPLTAKPTRLYPLHQLASTQRPTVYTMWRAPEPFFFGSPRIQWKQLQLFCSSIQVPQTIQSPSF